MPVDAFQKLFMKKFFRKLFLNTGKTVRLFAILSLAGAEIIFGLRLILLILGANEKTPIVSILYAASGYFSSPFSGIFPDFTVENRVIDMTTISAGTGYGFIIFLFLKFLKITRKQWRR